MTLRPPRDDEFDAMLELMNAHQLAAFGEADYTADDLRTWLTTPYVEVDRDIRVLERDGRLIGYVDADPTRDEPPLWWCDVKVAPDVDAGAVVAELVAWLEERAAEGRLRVWTSEDDAADRRRVRARSASSRSGTPTGWRSTSPTRRREPVWPSGISVRDRRRPTSTGSSTTPFVEVWQDTNDPIDETFEEWAHWHVERRLLRPVALVPRHAPATSSPGFSLCRQRPGRSRARATSSLLGVRRPGAGRVSARRSCSARSTRSGERGWTRGTLGVDASSPTGATRLYERAGMRVYRDTRLSRAGRAGVGCPREPPARPLS